MKRPPSDQFELDLALTGPDGGPVIGHDCRPIEDPPAHTAQIIKFPIGVRLRLTPAAGAIFRDMQRLAAADADGMACHSINDGIRCSAAPRHKVVQARRELQDKGLVALIRAGSELGPAVWRICRTQQIAF